jgi:hypothetical protein
MKSIQWDKGPITMPGMYAGIDIELYHHANICDGPSVSSGGLRTIFNESPAHFFAGWRGNPRRVERPENRALLVGRAAHHLLLGQDDFASMFVIQPEEYEAEDGSMKKWTYNARACQDWRKRRHDEGKTIVTQAEGEQIVAMAEVLGQHPIIRAGALNGLVERSLFWRDKTTGIWLKSRPDSIPGVSEDFVDYKTTTSVLWPDLTRTIAEIGYHQQGALVLRAAREVLGMKAPSFTLVFQEKTAPHCVRVVTLKESDIARGDKQNELALTTFASCLKANHWPGPGGDREDAEYIELPEWAQKSIDDKISNAEAQ